MRIGIPKQTVHPDFQPRYFRNCNPSNPLNDVSGSAFIFFADPDPISISEADLDPALQNCGVTLNLVKIMKSLL